MVIQNRNFLVILTKCLIIVYFIYIKIRCTHSDLPSVLEGLRATARFIKEPIDELILENNYLPSLPGRAFTPLKVSCFFLKIFFFFDYIFA